MRLKPKQTTLNPMASLYKRYNDLEKSFSANTVYKTADGKKWIFNKTGFIEIDYNAPLSAIVNVGSNRFLYETNVYHYENGWQKMEIIKISTEKVYYKGNDKYKYSAGYQQFISSEQEGTDEIVENALYYYGDKWYYYSNSTWQTTTSILSAQFGNIAKYQLNKYYFAGCFDWVLNSSIEGGTTQYVKGNIMPLENMSIKHFDDYINIQPDDLVVIDGKLYSVESVTVSHKHQPRDYTAYFADLNNIL